MRILVVGGSGFLGGAIARAAIAAGHDVTVLTRGNRPPPDGAARIVADRRKPLAPLGKYDAILDSCAYAPGDVTRLFDALAAAPFAYVLVSSISAYDGFPSPGQTESAPSTPANAEIIARAEADPDQIMAHYGPLKRATEIAAQDRMFGRAALIRLGLIVGAGDYTDRLTFWARRVAGGGDIPVPLPADRPVQLLDARDAAAFCLMAAQTGLAGPVNVTGRAIQFGAMLDILAQASGADMRLHWLPLERFLVAGLQPWSGVPLVLPPDPAIAGMQQVSSDLALAHGLPCRPFDETARDLIDWDRSQRDHALKAGFRSDLEPALLA